MNKMYTTPTYYLARLCSNLILFAMYPVILWIIIYWSVGMNTEFSSTILFLVILILAQFNGVALGFFCGSMFNIDYFARIFSQLMLNILMILGGSFINVNNFPPVIGWIQYFSPNRYSTEALFHLIVKTKLTAEEIVI
jgi:ABC-type multidrug transport system permease subunit